ncbi:hypothetical protein SDC9_185547 [bioreactor metagenome]|uniref:Uncharacterized protein n=1 Tax=bioreactor metagenome TaxID=1076179 RepID=A0A645HPH2_9ZZZZ
MADIGVFGFEPITVAFPGNIIIADTDGKAVVADSDNLVVGIDDAGSHLGVRVLAAHGREDGYAHEILVPTDVILTLGHIGSPCRAEIL